MPELAPKRDWKLSPSAFRELLRWLDEGTESDGRRFLEMRERLVSYFDRKNCLAPDELADETLNRVARRLEEEGAIETENAARYCYIVARFVFMEYLRAQEKDEAVRSEIRRESSDPQEEENDREIREQLLACLDECTGKLDATNRELILSYYVGKERVKIENRRALASKLGITMNALSIRACRIREKLEVCVRQCVGPK